MKTDNIVNFNRTYDKNELKNLIGWFVASYGCIKTKKLLDKLKILSLEWATDAGLSLGMGDLKIPPSKVDIVNNANNFLGRNIRKYKNGKLNIGSILQRENEIWCITSENLKNEVLNNLRQDDLLNPLYIMTISGARGNISQVKQLVGMRGFMSDSQGNLINLPIKTNFKEGISVMEYFISCYGARKGLIDTAIKTADSGYLTRRLVYAAQGLVIKKANCFTQYNTQVLISKKDKEAFNSLKNRLLGRVVAQTIVNDKNKILIGFGQDICNVRFEL